MHSGWLEVECRAGACPAVRDRKRILLRLAAAGVLEVPLLVCQRCGNRMATLVSVDDEPAVKPARAKKGT